MIANSIKVKGGSKSVLDYSEKKVMEGEAMVVRVKNIENDLIGTIYDTFESYESNVSIAAQTRKLVFHMSVDPDEKELAGHPEEHWLDMIDALMQEIGYGDQPYVVYRHSDIDRRHYHVVSPRVKKDGKVIDSAYEGKRIVAALRTLQDRFDFRIGLERQIEEKDSEAKPLGAVEKLHQTDSDKFRRFSAAWRDAMGYDFTSAEQFNQLLSLHGLKASVYTSKYNGKPMMRVYIKGPNGRPASRMYYPAANKPSETLRRYTERLAENAKRYNERKGKGAQQKTKEEKRLDAADEKMRVAIEYAFAKARTREEFSQILSECDIEFVPTVNTAGLLQTYLLIDTVTKHVASPQALGRQFGVSVYNGKEWERQTDKKQRILSESDMEAIKDRIAERLGVERPKEKTVQNGPKNN